MNLWMSEWVDRWEGMNTSASELVISGADSVGCFKVIVPHKRPSHV